MGGEGRGGEGQTSFDQSEYCTFNQAQCTHACMRVLGIHYLSLLSCRVVSCHSVRSIHHSTPDRMSPRQEKREKRESIVVVIAAKGKETL